MNKFLKRIISGVMMVSLGTVLVATKPAIADEVTVASTTTRTLSVDFMGRGNTPEESSPGSAGLTADDIGNEFWVGVAVDNVNDLPLFTNGIYSLEVAFEYDPNFVTPYFTSNSANAEWATALEGGNLASANSSTWWNSEQYEIISVVETDIDTVNDRENTDLMTDRVNAGWKMCTVCVSLKDRATFDPARFKDLSDAGKQYLVKLPFKLVAVPADGAVDPNPRVLSLVRGPETLNIGSGETGTEPYSSWEATVKDPNDDTNMKTLFTFPGDISLFGNGAIENIVPVKLKTGDETQDTTYTLSTTKDLTQDGFKVEGLTYYLSVPHSTEKIKLDITSSDLPEVVANSTNVTTTLTTTDKLYETDEFDLAELDKTVEPDGYNNTVTVTAGGTTYTIYIRRLLEPKIVLNPGNSPYGMIERMSVEYLGQTDGWSKDKVEQAKLAFDASHTINKTYGTGLVPNDAQTVVNYTTVAWEKSDKNYDMVEEAIFVYEGNSFTDPGYTVYDEFGDIVSNPSVTKDLSVRIISAGVPKYTDNEGSMVNIVETDGKFSLSKKIIRPDVYSLIYTCTYVDAVTSQQKTMSITRPVIILPERGDLTLTASPLINSNDATALKNNWSSLRSKSPLFAFRVADLQITATPLINSNDATNIKNNWSKGYVQYYSILN